MWEAIASTEIEPGQTIKFGGGDLEYEVLNVTRAPITNTVTSLITRRSSDGYTYQAVDFVTQCFQVWRKYAAPVTSDEGLVVESSTPDDPSPLLDTLRDELKARIQNVSDTVLLEAHQRGNGFAGLLAQIGEKLTESLELKHLRHAQQDAVKVELPRIDGHTADGTPLQHKTARQVLADAMLGKPMLSNGKPIGTIIETSVDEDGVRFVLQKNPTPFGEALVSQLSKRAIEGLSWEPRQELPQLPLRSPIGTAPLGFDFNSTYGRMETRIAFPGRGILTDAFGLPWDRIPSLAPPVKPEPTFTLAQLKSAVKKARKRAHRSALREMYGFIRNNLKLRAAEYGRIAVRFGMEDR